MFLFKGAMGFSSKIMGYVTNHEPLDFGVARQSQCLEMFIIDKRYDLPSTIDLLHFVVRFSFSIGKKSVCHTFLSGWMVGL